LRPGGGIDLLTSLKLSKGLFGEIEAVSGFCPGDAEFVPEAASYANPMQSSSSVLLDVLSACQSTFNEACVGFTIGGGDVEAPFVWEDELR
jgi:hypothetical protein